MSKASILLIEPFYGGSHKQLIDLLKGLFLDSAELFTMSSKKWHWRSITSALHFAEIIPKCHSFKYLFASSVLPLGELLALRPDLVPLHKIMYFHENQLNYPVREEKKRYFQHGYNEILSCLAADKVVFNSNFNKDSFLKRMVSFFNVMPDYRPKGLDNKIRHKCQVLYFPVELENEDRESYEKKSSPSKFDTEEPLHIVWPHRWEHDKDPDTFFSILLKLKEAGYSFNLSVIGETFSEKPKIFEEAFLRLKDHVLHWGYLSSKLEYYKVLETSDIVVSTSKHEFFGVSMLEATLLGCYPLCPKRLVYPEIYPEEYLYNTPNQLYKRLKYYCERPNIVRRHTIKVDLSRYSWDTLKLQYKNLFQTAAS